MFTEKQIAIRGAIAKNRNHEDIPTEIPIDKIEAAYREFCLDFCRVTLQKLEAYASGLSEPCDEIVSELLASANWYYAPWYTGPED